MKDKNLNKSYRLVLYLILTLIFLNIFVSKTYCQPQDTAIMSQNLVEYCKYYQPQFNNYYLNNLDIIEIGQKRYLMPFRGCGNHKNFLLEHENILLLKMKKYVWSDAAEISTQHGAYSSTIINIINQTSPGTIRLSPERVLLDHLQRISGCEVCFIDFILIENKGSDLTSDKIAPLFSSFVQNLHNSTFSL